MIEKFKIESISDNYEAIDKNCETYIKNKKSR